MSFSERLNDTLKCISRKTKVVVAGLTHVSSTIRGFTGYLVCIRDRDGASSRLQLNDLILAKHVSVQREGELQTQWVNFIVQHPLSDGGKTRTEIEREREREREREGGEASFY